MTMHIMEISSGAASPEQETADLPPITSPEGRVRLARNAEDVTPTGATLPRPWVDYRLEGEFADHAALVEAVQDALDDITLTPQRYAELMWLIDSWFVEGHDSQRRDTIALGRQRFRGG
jgi:hypothetical protein